MSCSRRRLLLPRRRRHRRLLSLSAFVCTLLEYRCAHCALVRLLHDASAHRLVNYLPTQPQPQPRRGMLLLLLLWLAVAFVGVIIGGAGEKSRRR